jgi:hypothetical protein
MKASFKIKTILPVIIFFGFFGFAKSSLAATFWVSPTGLASWTNCQGESPLAGASACSLSSANQNAQAGDLVYFRAGDYIITTRYGFGLNPKNSGNISNKIIFQAYGSEKPVITSNIDSTYGIVLSNNDYIKIDGLTVKNVNLWMYIINNSDHNEVVNCTFTNDTGEEGGFGLNINEMCAGGMTYTCPSSHNWIHSNTFSKIHAYPAGQSCVEGADLVRIGGDGTGSSGGNDYNTIENNNISYAGHALFDSYSRFNVFRNNVLHNEPWITDYSGGTCHHTSTYVDTKYNGKFSHRCMQITGALYPETGTRDLIEGNRMGYSGVNPNNPGAINFEVAAAKNIIRFNDIYGSMRLGLGFKYSYSGDNRLYRNTFYHNGFGYDWKLYDAPNDDRGQIKGYSPDSRKNIIKENITYDSPVGTSSYGYWWGDITQCSTSATCENNWLTSNGDPKFSNPDLSNTQSQTLPDLSLQSSSGAINKGSYLTQANGSGSNSTTLVVDDALYFQDGTWGSDLARRVTLFSDWIAIGTVNNTVQISSVNYDANAITLVSPMTWPDNAPIWLYKKSDGSIVLHGSAPDYGAYEYQSDGDMIPPAYPVNLIVR